MSFLKLMEPCQWVVVEVVGILVELPRDAGLFVEFIYRLPLQRVTVDVIAVATWGY